MHLLIHDYSGHPFQVQLSRALARRGHRVTHLYNASNPTTPKGGLARRGDDPDMQSGSEPVLPKRVAAKRVRARSSACRKAQSCRKAGQRAKRVRARSS